MGHKSDSSSGSDSGDEHKHHKDKDKKKKDKKDKKDKKHDKHVSMRSSCMLLTVIDHSPDHLPFPIVVDTCNFRAYASSSSA